MSAAPGGTPQSRPFLSVLRRRPIARWVLLASVGAALLSGVVFAVVHRPDRAGRPEEPGFAHSAAHPAPATQGKNGAAPLPERTRAAPPAVQGSPGIGDPAAGITPAERARILAEAERLLMPHPRGATPDDALGPPRIPAPEVVRRAPALPGNGPAPARPPRTGRRRGTDSVALPGGEARPPAADPLADVAIESAVQTFPARSAPFVLVGIRTEVEPPQARLAPRGTGGRGAIRPAWFRVGDTPAPGWLLLTVSARGAVLLSPRGNPVRLSLQPLPRPGTPG